MGKCKFSDTIYDTVSVEEGHNAPTQSKVYGLSRTLFFLVAIYTMLTISRFMWAFPPFYDMLLSSGAFAWLCEGTTAPVIIEGVKQPFLCLAQDEAISRIYSLITGSVLISSIFAGAFNLILGAKKCGMIGSALIFCGTILMGVSNENFRAHHAAAVLLGLGMDAVSFPCFNSTLLFPGHELFVTSILASGISVGMALPLLMKLLFEKFTLSFATLMIWYAFLAPGLCFILYTLFYPPNRFYKQHELDTALQYILSNAEDSPKVGVEDDVAHSPLENESKDSDDHSIKMRILSAFGISNQNYDLLCKSLLSMHFLLITVVFICVMLTSVFYMSASSQLLSNHHRNVLAIGMPLAFIPCVVLSPLLDRLGSMFVLWFEVIFEFFMILFLWVNSNVARFISIACYSFYASYLNGQLWVFSVETFDPSIHTFMLGLLSFVGGISALIAPYAYGLFIEGSDSGIANGIPLFLGIVVIQIIVLGFLHVVKHKKNKIF
ncbi:hypothetical protein BEWA_020000 [Theileria equi strain WA]|uniref:Uncharacterized protein n=1 Tax=Theileria equi strain WA TaxID=1537102 RepID=L0AW76_THEEQ|nr:hypothetical protein BEWA_020000 [Theileria equi strain WA]AFZ79154.1 hypothetical protein BEWA_020000 [Theileria equi strain WA]|eukprot:XP_004828820.1 hypothetical protein BEWA_020000 [Theileria equi strain WA]